MSRVALLNSAGALCIIAMAFPSYLLTVERSLSVGGFNELIKPALYWLVVPFVLSMLFFRFRGVVLTISCVVMTLILLPVVLPFDFADMTSTIALIGILGALTLVASRINDRQSLLADAYLSKLKESEDQLLERKVSLEALVDRQSDELRDTAQIIEAVLDSSPAAVVAVDDEDQITLWNPAATRIFGWTSQEVMGQANPTGVTKDSWNLPGSSWKRDEENDVVTGTITRKDGETLRVTMATAPLADSSGHVAIFTDITEKTRLEEQLRQSQKMEAIGQLAGGIAHDFNNLLTVINGYAETIAKELDKDHPQREDALVIAEAGGKATELIAKILTFGRRQALTPRALDPNETIRDVQGMLARLLPANIELRFRLDPLIGAVEADIGQIEQILINLAVNAADAMPRGGRLTFETSPAHNEMLSYVHRKNCTASELVKITISDTGVGMAPEIKARVFEPFFTTKEAGRGTGLGLATVYGIVRQCGGIIDIDSVVGRGTTFHIFLPTTNKEVQDIHVRRTSSMVPCGSETILVVEDDALVRRFIKRSLSQLGYSVILANSGEEAIDIYRQERKVDLILSDVVMPGMSGLECVESLRKIAEVPVIFISGHAEEELLQMGGGDNIQLLQKPFRLKTLARKVRGALESAQRC